MLPTPAVPPVMNPSQLCKRSLPENDHEVPLMEPSHFSDWAAVNNIKIEFVDEETDAVVPTAPQHDPNDIMHIFEDEYEKYLIKAVSSERKTCYHIIETYGYRTITAYDDVDRIIWATKHLFKKKYNELKAEGPADCTPTEREFARLTVLLEWIYIYRNALFGKPMKNKEFQATWRDVKDGIALQGFHEMTMVSAIYLRFTLWPRIRALTERKFLTGVGTLNNFDYTVMRIDPTVSFSVLPAADGTMREAPLPVTDKSYWYEHYRKSMSMFNR